MSRLLVLLASAAVVAVAPLGGSASAADSGRTPYVVKPRLAVVDFTPLTVRGTSFKARERVTVTLDGGKRGMQRVQATRRGGFTATFRIMPAIGCQRVTIGAVGSLGSRVFKQIPRPDCREP